MSHPRNSSSSLRRALAVLDHLADFSGHDFSGHDFSGHPDGASLGELSSGLNLPKPTLLRLLAPLREARLVELHPETGRYRLGPHTARLGQRYLDRLELREVAGDLLRRLAAASGETVHLVVPDPPWVVYVDKVESPNLVRMYSRVGSRQPMHSTAVGKALLAHLDERALGEVVAAGLTDRTGNTVTAEHRLRAELRQVRERGYAVDDVENEPEIRCVAAPVFDHADRPAAAVSVAGPEYRVMPARVPELATEVMAAAGELSGRLGAPVDQTDRGLRGLRGLRGHRGHREHRGER